MLAFKSDGPHGSGGLAAEFAKELERKGR